MRLVPVKNAALAFLLALICGIVGEALMFMGRQCRQVESFLAEDFRLVAFLASDLPETKVKILEEKLRALAGVGAVSYVSRDAALEEIKGQDPELGRAVVMLGENPLNAAFELRLSPAGVSRVPELVSEAQALAGIGDVRYKPLQAGAMLQVQFYSRFIELAGTLAGFFWLIGAAAMAWAAAAREGARSLPSGFGRLAASALSGVCAGMTLVFLSAYPLKAMSRMWIWPGLGEHAALALVGTMGAVFFSGWEELRGQAEGGGQGKDSKEEAAVVSA